MYLKLNIVSCNDLLKRKGKGFQSGNQGLRPKSFFDVLWELKESTGF